jgi:hypothetical protein
VDIFSAALDPLAVQNRDFDWGDGRELRLTYRPGGGLWKIAAGARYGRANTETTRLHQEESAGPPICGEMAFYASRCDPENPNFRPTSFRNATNWSDASARSREEYTVADFVVGRDVGLGLIGSKSSLGLGLRYAQLESTSDATMEGIPDWELHPGWLQYPNSTGNQYKGTLSAQREFEGAGPTLSWEAAQRLLGNEEIGHVDLDWSLTGGVLFGKQKTATTGTEAERHFEGKYSMAFGGYLPLPSFTVTPVQMAPRSDSVSVPIVDLSLGLSYEIQRIKIGAGYRWERYFDVLDTGFEERKETDRTIDGPYFKLSVGFGG